MKLELYINGKKKDVMHCDFVFDSYDKKLELIKQAIQKIKSDNHWEINNANEWKIFMVGSCG